MIVNNKLVLIDSNVILDIVTNDKHWCNWAIDTLEQYRKKYRLMINSIVYSEISIGFSKIEDLEKVLQLGEFGLLEIPREALFLAGKVFLEYRRNSGTKTSCLPDFFIAAHAAVLQSPLITRDTKRMNHYFPKLELVTPAVQ